MKNLIKNIGRAGVCNDAELLTLLPNYPVLRGSEWLFTIGWADAHRYIDNDVESFVKGLHFVEEAYKLKSGNDFGFGSPGPTAKVIDAVGKTNPALALTLREWVGANGGNYYIEKR